MEMSKNELSLIVIDTVEASIRKKKKGKGKKPFSLLRRGRSISSRQVSWLRLRPTCRVFPSFDPAQDSDLSCGVRRLYSGGTAPDLHRTSLTPRTRIETETTTRKNSCQDKFDRLGGVKDFGQ